MLVRDYMTTNVTTLTDDLRLLDAALMIRRTGKRHVPILSATDGTVVGIITQLLCSSFPTDASTERRRRAIR